MFFYEEKIRKVLSDLFPNHGFKSEHPRFLFNKKTKSRLEIDCFNKELGIAVEVNGKFHVKDPFTFGISQEFYSSLKTRSKDHIKTDLIEKFNKKKQRIIFLVVPYLDDKNFDLIISYIYGKLYEHKKLRSYFSDSHCSKINQEDVEKVQEFNDFQAKINKFVFENHYCFNQNNPYFHYDFMYFFSSCVIETNILENVLFQIHSTFI